MLPASLCRVGLALALLLLLGGGCGDEAPEPERGRASASGGPSDAPLVPLSGRRPAHVVGARTFSRFHLLTAGEGFPRSAGEEDAAEGVEARAAKAIRELERAADEARAAGRVREAARGYMAAGRAALDATWRLRAEGCFARALHCWARVHEAVEMLEPAQHLVDLRTARRDSLAAARSRADVGALYAMIANYERALDFLAPAAEAFGRFGLRRLQAHALASMGLVYHRRTEYGPALDVLERARDLLGDTRGRSRKAYVLGALGSVHEHLGDPEEARRLYQEALALLEGENSADRGDLLGNLGNLRFHQGEDEAAVRDYEQALAIFRPCDDVRGMAGALFGIGRVRKLQGGYRTALEIYGRALDLQCDDVSGAVRTRAAMAEAYLAMGRLDDAEAEVATALDEIPPGGMLTERVELLVVSALVDLRRKRPSAAVSKIRRALDILVDVTGGLADEHVVGLREHRGWVFDAGVAVALRTGRTDLAAEFLEHGRAGALLEALGARGALKGVPSALHEEASRAAHVVAKAHRAYQAARAERDLGRLRSAREALRSSRAEHRAVMQRLQRASKRAASVFHPVPDSLREMRRALEPGDVLVLYAVLAFQTHALVVTPDAPGRVVWLGNTADLRGACEALRAAAAGEAGVSAEAVESMRIRLRRMLIEPLGLPPGTKRLLLGPDGPLCYVPWPFVVGEAPAEVACLPSGTTLRLLSQESAKTGTRVLALGDPQYRLEHQGRSLQVYAEGVPLKALPATRAEVMAITGPDDMRLLGSYATVRGLTEVAATNPRWSAIHLACHGLIDPRTPTLSSLALTPDAGDDGFLTALEVYGLSLPADLVVLSGCNTGRGRFMKGEGLVGLMRAFMCAGAPRVVVSLWKVDDEATRALMVAFHRLRREGRGTAAALRAAQADVRKVQAWRHPRYWAAWSLWGLAD